jgi:dUTP pyrophosphatase
MTMILPVRLLTATATLPCRAEAGSVGHDLFADLGGGSIDVVANRAPLGIGTGVAVALPPGTYGRVAPRSGLAAKFGIDVLAGVIDPSYRGEIRVLLVRHGDGFLTIKHGDRIAQLIVERCETPAVQQVETLDDTARGAGGFGSTGR